MARAVAPRCGVAAVGLWSPPAARAAAARGRCRTAPLPPGVAALGGGGVRAAGAAHALRGGAGGWVGVWHVVSAAVGGWVCVDTVISAAVAGALGHVLSAAVGVPARSAAPIVSAAAPPYRTRVHAGGGGGGSGGGGSPPASPRVAPLYGAAAAGRGDCGRMFTYVLPAHWVDAIPAWLLDEVVRPAAAAGMVPSFEWVNQVVVMAYDRGGSIRSHTDPVQLFHRPVVTTSFGCSCSLAFGV
eukprot:gene5837-21179_t